MTLKRVPQSRQILLDAALFYCGQRETSRPKLETYLIHKFVHPETPEEKQTEIREWIESTLLELERMKVLDHERFAGMIAREYARRGKGKHYVQNKLREKGLEAEIPYFEFNEEDELEKACALVEKTMQRSNIAKIEDVFLKKQKIMQKLISSGFELSVAKKAISLKV